MSFTIGQKVKTIPATTSTGTLTGSLFGVVVATPPGSDAWFIKYYEGEWGDPVSVQFSTDGPLCQNLLPTVVLFGENGLVPA